MLLGQITQKQTCEPFVELFSHRPDGLPVAEPTVAKHCNKINILIT